MWRRGIQENQNVYINKDQTPLEHRHWRKLLEEQKPTIQQLAETNEDANWIIRKRQVVKGRSWKRVEERETKSAIYQEDPRIQAQELFAELHL